MKVRLLLYLSLSCQVLFKHDTIQLTFFGNINPIYATVFVLDSIHVLGPFGWRLYVLALVCGLMQVNRQLGIVLICECG